MKQQRHVRRVLILLLVGALLVLGLAGAMEAAGASESPAPDKVMYKVGILAEPDNLNPFIGYLWSSFEIWYLAYDPLVGFDYGELKPIKGEDSPALPPTGR